MQKLYLCEIFLEYILKFLQRFGFLLFEKHYSELKENVKLREKISKNAQNYVMEKFNLEEFIPQKYHVLAVILFIFILFFVLMRAALPRPRYDQLISFGWKILLPLSLLNILVTAAILLA